MGLLYAFLSLKLVTFITLGQSDGNRGCQLILIITFDIFSHSRGNYLN